MKKLISLLLVLAIVFSFCACSKINRLFSKNAEQSFSYPIAQMPTTLDPQIASGEAELIIIENCMEGLVRLNAAGEVEPAIAQSWEISADGLRYTFHLNSSARWAFDKEDAPEALQNFNPTITAKDFVFAVSRAVQKQTAAPDFQSVSLIKNALKIHSSGKSDTSSLGIKAPDDSTLVITLESANSAFLRSLTGAVFMPCSEEFFEYCAGRYGRQSRYFLSNAGFELRSWNETNLVMRKNEDYALSHPAKADTVTLYRDENAFESFKNNNYDALAISDDNIDEALADKSLRVQTYDDTVWTLAFNLKSQLCGNKNCRRALAACLDTIGLTAPEWCAVAPGIVPNICTVGTQCFLSARKEATFVAYAPDKAAALYESFSQSYMAQEDVKEMPVMRFLCTAPFEQCAKQIAQGWQQHFGTGFEVRISVLGIDELTEAIDGGEFDAVLMPMSADTEDALVFLKKFAAQNVFSYQSAAYNRLINSGRAELKKCIACENALLADAVVYPLFTSNSYYVSRNQVEGIYFYAFGGKVNFLNAERTSR